MKRFSEYVSLGHPDKTADYISQYLLDRYIERDPDTRYAVEVQIKGEHVSLGGEVSSKAQFTEQQLGIFVRKAVCEIGYTRSYQRRWGAENTICGEDLAVDTYVSQQSPDIARGVDNDGWGDQGIFFGYCNRNAMTHGMPYDHAVAKRLCKGLFDSGLGGLDIKTQVVTDNNVITKIIIAIPLLNEDAKRAVEGYVLETVSGRYKLIVNGTGRYVAHSTVADCGTTGRKLAVDFYGGNCLIGGGSPWTKDAGKADLTLNLAARKLARRYSAANGCDTIVRLACCIGHREVDMCVQDSTGKVIAEGEIELDPKQLRHEYRLDTPIYTSMCRWGLFGEYQKDKVWEQ